MTASNQPQGEVTMLHVRVIWLDRNAFTESNKQDQRKLSQHFGRFKVVENISECRTAINETVSGRKLVLIVSGQLGSEFVPTNEANPNISSIYVYCQDTEGHRKWADKCSKVNDVTNNMDQLISKIRADYPPS